MKFPVKLYFCMITHNRAYESLEVVRNIFPHVDRLVIIDGGSTDGTLAGLKEIAGQDYTCVDYGSHQSLKTDKKMVIVNKTWCDNFPAQRNAYVEMVSILRGSQENSWIVVSDSDEYLSPRLRKQLRTVIEKYAEPKHLTMLLVRARDITYLRETGEQISQAVPDYWKNLIYKWNPELRITGDHVHEGFNMNFNIEKLPDNIEKGKEFEILYEHRKPAGAVWERAHCRNFFIRGGGPNLADKQKLWLPFRELVIPLVAEFFNMPEDEVLWHHYRDYLKAGNIDRRLKYWFVRYCMEGVANRPKQLEFVDNGQSIVIHLQQSATEASLGYGYDGASEVREGYQYYFRVLHTDEEFPEMQGFHIP